MTDIRAYADAYARAGMCPIPVPHCSKRATIGWKQFQRRRPTAAERARLFSNGPVNVATVLGRVAGNLVDLDIDDSLLFENFVDANRDLLDLTLVVRSHRGGHVIFRSRQASPSVLCDDENPIELRGEGHYVLLPPSVHPDGGIYHFVRTPKTVKMLVVDDAVPWLNERLARLGLTFSAEGRRPSEEGEPGLWRQLLANGATEGGRNTRLASLAGKLRAANLSLDEGLTLVSAINVGYCQPPLPDSEVEELVRGIWRRYLVPAKDEKMIPQPKRSESCGIEFDPVPVGELLAREHPEIRWVWEGYAPEGGLLLIAGHPKTGKSTLGFHLAGAAAKGGEFLGRKVTETPVLILALEERPQDVANRLRRLGVEHNVYVHTGPLRADAAMGDIGAFVREKGIGLVIVDTLPRFWNVADENDAARVGEALEGVLGLARQTGAAVLLVFHLRKSPGEDGSDIRGSGDIFAHVDVALTLRRRKEAANQRLLQAFSRYDDTPAEVVIALEGEIYEALGARDEVELTEQRSRILAALGDEPQTSDEIAEASGLKPGTARSLLKALFQGGEVERGGAGKKNDPYKFSRKIDSAENQTL